MKTDWHWNDINNGLDEFDPHWLVALMWDKYGRKPIDFSKGSNNISELGRLIGGLYDGRIVDKCRFGSHNYWKYAFWDRYKTDGTEKSYTRSALKLVKYLKTQTDGWKWDADTLVEYLEKGKHNCLTAYRLTDGGVVEHLLRMGRCIVTDIKIKRCCFHYLSADGMSAGIVPKPDGLHFLSIKGSWILDSKIKKTSFSHHEAIISGNCDARKHPGYDDLYRLRIKIDSDDFVAYICPDLLMEKIAEENIRDHSSMMKPIIQVSEVTWNRDSAKSKYIKAGGKLPPPLKDYEVFSQ